MSERCVRRCEARIIAERAANSAVKKATMHRDGGRQDDFRYDVNVAHPDDGVANLPGPNTFSQ